jgi:hypothetical protein
MTPTVHHPPRRLFPAVAVPAVADIFLFVRVTGDPIAC